ncbi:hypothetical protein QYF61_022014 [Mycteria americana]|uniref:Uncharacterized protein n=1 Tax=Mycteria americana TaxID=33587 RepID=A0AAN7NLT5_MYCAM|nr:hypothetical protein QYF61_022014 [Mycteria americana]
MGSQPPSGIHLLWRGVLHRLQVDICSTVNLLHGLQGDSLPHHGLHHGLQGNLCSGAWSSSSPPSSLTLMAFNQEHTFTKYACKPQVAKSEPPVPMLDHPFSKEIFPNIQSKPLLTQLEAISSCPITCYWGEETDPHLSTTSFQVAVESDKVSPQPLLLQAKQTQFPQPLLTRLVLQTLHQLRCPSLDTFRHLNDSLVVKGPKLNTVFNTAASPGGNHFPSPAGHTIPDTSQDAIDLLGHLGTLLAHIQLAVNQHPQVLLCWAAFQPLFPKPVAMHEVVVTQVQDPALGLVEPHTIGLGPSIQPLQVPLQSLPPLKQINAPAQLDVICKLTEGALDPFVQIIDKDIKQNWPQHRALGNTTCDRPPTGVNSIHHHSLGPAIQPVLYPAKSAPIPAMSRQFLQENAVGDSVKGFTKVQVDNIHSLSLIHYGGHLVTEGDQVGQAGPAFHEPMLAGPDSERERRSGLAMKKESCLKEEREVFKREKGLAELPEASSSLQILFQPGFPVPIAHNVVALEVRTNGPLRAAAWVLHRAATHPATAKAPGSRKTAAAVQHSSLLKNIILLINKVEGILSLQSSCAGYKKVCIVPNGRKAEMAKIMLFNFITNTLLCCYILSDNAANINFLSLWHPFYLHCLNTLVAQIEKGSIVLAKRMTLCVALVCWQSGCLAARLVVCPRRTQPSRVPSQLLWGACTALYPSRSCSPPALSQVSLFKRDRGKLERQQRGLGVVGGERSLGAIACLAGGLRHVALDPTEHHHQAAGSGSREQGVRARVLLGGGKKQSKVCILDEWFDDCMNVKSWEMIYKDAEVLAQMLYSLSMFALHSVADYSGNVDAQMAVISMHPVRDCVHGRNMSSFSGVSLTTL